MREPTTSTTTSSQSSPEAFLETRSLELAELEAAALVLSPILSDEDLRHYSDEFESLHERIDALSSLLAGSSDDFLTIAERAAAQFAEVGSALSDLLQQTQARIPEADLSKLRPAVRQFCTTNRADVESVLDLCLRDLDAFDDFWPLIDMIVGRMCAPEADSRAELGIEPHHLTPRLAQVCGEACDMFPGATREAASVFRTAIVDVEATRVLPDLEPIVERVFKHKQSLGRKVLLPAVLRSSVLYNLTIKRRIEELAPVDEDLVASVDMNLGYMDEADQAAATAERAARLRTSVFEHAGIEQLELALRARVDGSKGPSGPARIIAAGCDLAKLTDFDREALVAASMDNEIPALPRMLVIGLIIEQLERIDDELRTLEIDPDELADEWVPEVREALRTQTRELIRAGRYQETREPCEALSRLLPIWVTSERARARGARRVAVHTIATDGIDLRALLDAYNDDTTVKRAWGMRHTLAVAMLMLAIITVGRIAVGPSTSVKSLDRTVLAAFSKHLDSAQRTEEGYGDAMAGRLRSTWSKLDEEDQYKAAMRLARDLREDGLLNVLLVDSQRRLQVKIAGGRLTYPKRP